MSQPDLSSASPPRGVLVQKPKTSVYTVMLIVSLVAILIGVIFLYLEIRAFGGFGQIKGRLTSVDRPTAVRMIARDALPEATFPSAVT